MPKEFQSKKEAILSSPHTRSGADPTRIDDKPGEGPEHSSPALRIREAARDPTRILEDQNWRCAMPCGGNGEGRPMLPGEPFAYIDDHSGIVHLDCVKAGTVPNDGNPWTINGARRGTKRDR